MKIRIPTGLNHEIEIQMLIKVMENGLTQEKNREYNKIGLG